MAILFVWFFVTECLTYQEVKPAVVEPIAEIWLGGPLCLPFTPLEPKHAALLLLYLPSLPPFFRPSFLHGNLL